MFGSRSSRRRPSAKWNIKLTYRWILCARACVCHICTCVRRLLRRAMRSFFRHVQWTRAQRETGEKTRHMHTFSDLHSGYTNNRVSGGPGQQMCVCVCRAGALGRESNAKLVLSSCQIIQEPAAEVIIERLVSSSPRPVSLAPPWTMFYSKCHAAQKLVNKHNCDWQFFWFDPEWPFHVVEHLEKEVAPPWLAAVL